jgi:hypothetical protein
MKLLTFLPLLLTTVLLHIQPIHCESDASFKEHINDASRHISAGKMEEALESFDKAIGIL